MKKDLTAAAFTVRLSFLCSPGMVTVHFALVTVQERHGQDVICNSSGYKLTQHLRKTGENTFYIMVAPTDFCIVSDFVAI